MACENDGIANEKKSFSRDKSIQREILGCVKSKVYLLQKEGMLNKGIWIIIWISGRVLVVRRAGILEFVSDSPCMNSNRRVGLRIDNSLPCLLSRRLTKI